MKKFVVFVKEKLKCNLYSTEALHRPDGPQGELRYSTTLS